MEQSESNVILNEVKDPFHFAQDKLRDQSW